MRALGALLVAWLALAAPAGATDVHVTINGHGGVTLSPAQVDADAIGAQDYTLRDDAGHESVLHNESGTTVASVAQLAGLPPSVVKAMEVARNGTGSVHLSGDEVRDGFTGDPLGPRFAIIYTGGGDYAEFTRPLRDDSDANFFDSFQTSQALEVAVTTTNDAIRDVSASADDTTPAPGTADGFSARVDNPPDKVDFSYRWDFDDGKSATGPAPSHTFAAGHYRVTVTVVGDDGSSGVSDPIDIQVGTPSQATATPTVTATPSGGAQPPGGAQPEGGGDGSPDDGATGPAKSHGHSGKTHTPKTHATPAVSPAAPATTPPPVAPTPAPGTFAAKSPPPATPTPAPTATRTATATPARPTPRQVVDGLLVADAGSVPDLARIVASATQRTPARRGGGGSTSALGWIGGGGLLVLLLAGGAAAEIRGRLW